MEELRHCVQHIMGEEGGEKFPLMSKIFKNFLQNQVSKISAKNHYENNL